MKETRALWEAWSESFQAAWEADTDEGELPPADVHIGPGVADDERLGLLPGFEGQDVVELGCGGGQASVGFARRGAGSVTGVDFSVEQLDYAQGLADRYGVGVRFAAGDVTALPLATDGFDLAFSSWVYQMVGDLDGAFAEAARVLRPGGTLLFAVPHPFYELYDPEARELDRSYFDGEPERKSIGDLDPDLVVHHHTVGELHGALVDAGFAVEALLEPGSEDPGDYEEQWSHKPELMAMVPPTLVVRARLPS